MTFGQPMIFSHMYPLPHHPYAPLMPQPQPPGRGIYWQRVVLLQVSLTFGQPLDQADLWSDVPHPLVEAPLAKSGAQLGPLDLTSYVPPPPSSSV